MWLRGVLGLVVWTLGLSQVFAAEGSETDAPIKFAITSAAWGENVNAGLRIVAENRSQVTLRLESVRFLNAANSHRFQPGVDEVELSLDLTLPAGQWGEVQLPLAELLGGNRCIEDTLDVSRDSEWKLVEISNHALNPSVRSLIIEDSNSFRIYSCPRDVLTTWVETESRVRHTEIQWVLYHFESRTPGR